MAVTGEALTAARETEGERRMSFGIFPKLLFTMIVVAVVPLAAIWYLDYRSSLERLTSQIDQQLSSQSDTIVNYVDAWVDMNLKMAHQNAALEDIISMDARRQAPILRSIAGEYTWIYLAFTIGLDGHNIGRSDQDTPKYYGDRIYVQQVLNGEPMGRQVIISRTTGQPSFVLSVPITAGKGLVGVLAIGTSISDMSKRVTNVRIGQTGYAFLLGETGDVIAHPSARGSLAEHKAFVGLGRDAKKQLIFSDPSSGKRVIAYAQRTRYGWVMVTQQNYDEAYRPITEANRNALVLLGVTLVFVLVVSYFLAQRFTRPIRNLTQIADGISRGDLGAMIEEVNRSDEIGGLARAIERLSVSVKLAMKRLAKA